MFEDLVSLSLARAGAYLVMPRAQQQYPLQHPNCPPVATRPRRSLRSRLAGLFHRTPASTRLQGCG